MTALRTTIATAALAVVLVGAPAWAQADLRALHQRDEILQQQEIARQDALANQRALSAAQSRYDTQLTLRALSEAAAPRSAEPTLRPAVAPPPRGPSAADMAADAARMDSLIDTRLAESNARLRAVTPAH